MSELKLYFGLAGAAIVLAAFTWWSVHRENVGERKIIKKDDTALAVRHTEVVAQTAANVAKADAADSGADHDQQVIDAYLQSHPTGDVRMCRPAGNSIQRVPAIQASDSNAVSAPAGSDALSSMPGSVAGPDISEGLTIIVRAASRLAIQDRDLQTR